MPRRPRGAGTGVSSSFLALPCFFLPNSWAKLNRKSILGGIAFVLLAWLCNSDYASRKYAVYKERSPLLARVTEITSLSKAWAFSKYFYYYSTVNSPTQQPHSSNGELSKRVGSLSDTEQRETEEFFKWANEELGIEHNLRVGYTYRENPNDAAAENIIRIRGVFAKSNIEEGEEVVSVPLDKGGMTFYPAGEEKSRHVFDALQKFLGQREVRDKLGERAQEWAPWFKMAIALIYHVALGEAGIFSKYIQHSLLPMTNLHHVYVMESREEVEKAFPVKFGFGDLFDISVQMRGLTATFRDIVNPFLLRKFPKIFQESDLTFEKWIWAFGTIQARIWGLEHNEDSPWINIKEKYPKWNKKDGESFLFPVADLINHDQVYHNTACGMELANDGRFHQICRAIEDIEEGTEILYAYSELCKQDSAHQYGFWAADMPECEKYETSEESETMKYQNFVSV